MQKQIKTIVILGGGLFKDSAGCWRTTLGEAEGDKFGSTNDHLRVLAAAALWEQEKNLKIIAFGGRGQLEDLLPPKLSVAKVIKDELIALSVPTEKIIEENKSGSTYEQLATLSEMVKSGAVSGEVSIISNEWHLPRVKVMVEYTGLKKVLNEKQVSFVAAEDVLLRLKPKEWREFIEKSRKSKGMKKRFDIEAKGVEQIKNGIYKFARK